MTKTRIRAAAADDWPAIWRFMRPIVAAGETFAWDRDIAEEEARARWCHEAPGRTFVAVDDRGSVVGTAEGEPNHGGPAAHVATASFMAPPPTSLGAAASRTGTSTTTRSDPRPSTPPDQPPPDQSTSGSSG